MMIKRDALVEENACKEGLEFFDTHFPAGEGTQEEVFEALAKYAPTQDWQAWLARNLRLTATCRKWHKNGKIEEEQSFVDGYRHGVYIAWYGNGQKLMEETWDNGQSQHNRMLWDMDGKEGLGNSHRLQVAMSSND